MVSPAVLAKENQALPDFFGMKIAYLTGESEEFEVASMFLDFVASNGNAVIGVSNQPFMVFATTDDEWVWVPIASIKNIKFNKNYSKMMALREEEAQKNVAVQKS